VHLLVDDGIRNIKGGMESSDPSIAKESMAPPSAQKRPAPVVAKAITSDNQEDERDTKRLKAGPPDYGTQAYWEERYVRQLGSPPAESEPAEDNAPPAQDEDTLPYHAWYFTYADLRPLILPLIVGGRNDVYNIMQEAERADEESDADIDDGDTATTVIEESPRSETTEGAGPSDQPLFEESIEQTEESDEDDAVVEDDGFIEVEEGEQEDDDEEEEDPVEREGLSQNGPISIVEIGCGDVPLGAGLALELKELEEKTGAPAASIVKQILCTDYSPTVVEAMKAQYRPFDESIKRPKHSADIGDIPLEFAEADARQLPAANRSVHLILEKGTLDAMLSDEKDGISNCIQIIRESARVLAMDGYIFLVSHVNAHTEGGSDWLQEVVVEGLQNGDSDAAWIIEVHGNAEIRDDLPGVPSGSPGPAVYIIRKKERKDGEDSMDRSDNATIPVKFYSY
jgi:hypothetical protein